MPVIGAGVVGLTIGCALAMRGIETIVLKRANAIGNGTNSRNSEVIHAGIYYPSGSLKARRCVAGREQLYRYCESHGVAHRRCGKLLVATSELQRAKLALIQAQATRNCVHDFRCSKLRRRARSSRRCARSRRCNRPRPASSTATR